MQINRYIKDERTESANKKIESEAFKIAIYLILISALVKTRLFGYPVEASYFDIGILAALSIYVNAKRIIKGVGFIGQKPFEKKIMKYTRTIVITFVAAGAASMVLAMVEYFAFGHTFIEIISSLWPIFTVLPAVIALIKIIFDFLAERKMDKDI